MVYTRVVFGRSILDFPLATDFVVISKKFISDGLNPTCLLGIDLADVINMSGRLLFGRDDLRDRVQVYDHDEAQSPFYQLSAPHCTKHLALSCIRNIAPRLRPGDHVILVFTAHGQRDTNIILHNGPLGIEYLTKTEAIAALSILPASIRILLVNEACYSGGWTTAAPVLGDTRDIMVETASATNEKASNYRSFSLTKVPLLSLLPRHIWRSLPPILRAGISQHCTRIKEEMRYVAPDQDINTPLTICSSQALWSHNISHFILSPNIAMLLLI